MPKMPCPRKVDCPPEGPLINYSSETEDFLDFTSVINIEIPPPIGGEWIANGCIGVCTSLISQEDADLCAQRQAILCIDGGGGDQFQNAEQTCQSNCPDGTIFTFVVPAGMFVGASQAEVDAQALAYACQQAELRKLCLGPMQKCYCTGVPIPDQTIVATGPVRALTFMVTSGSLPPGLTIDTSVRSDMQTIISGTPTLAGNYNVQITAMDAQGNFAVKPYAFAVIAVSTTVLPNFTIGTPYSFQMQASGGSGNYAWKILSGTLPTGLSMSVTGLISGTPTAGGSATLVFDVIDTDCQEADRTFFPPRITMTTLATTRLATVIGYSEFTTPSVPPKKYHKLSWDGNTYQWGHVLSTGELCGSARFQYTGTSEINTSGQHISLYSKNFFAACPDDGSPGQWPQYLPNGNNSVNVGTTKFIGYCWDLDPNSCADCAAPPEFVSDQGGDYTGDVSPFIHGNTPTFVDKTHFHCHKPGAQPSTGFIGPWDAGTDYLVGQSVSLNHFFYVALLSSGPSVPAGSRNPETEPSYWQMVADFSFPGSIEPVVNFPDSIFNDIPHWIRLFGSHWYEGLLENEYTDAEALAASVPYTSGGNTAENSPRTTGFTSRFVSVAYTLHCTNLIAGQDYTVTVRIYNTTTGTSTFRTYSFLAINDNETITDTIPTPPVGQPLQVKDPGIAFT